MTILSLGSVKLIRNNDNVLVMYFNDKKKWIRATVHINITIFFVCFNRNIETQSLTWMFVLISFVLLYKFVILYLLAFVIFLNVSFMASGIAAISSSLNSDYILMKPISGKGFTDVPTSSNCAE